MQLYRLPVKSPHCSKLLQDDGNPEGTSGSCLSQEMEIVEIGTELVMSKQKTEQTSTIREGNYSFSEKEVGQKKSLFIFMAQP